MKTRTIRIVPTWTAIAAEIEFHSIKHGRAQDPWKKYLYTMAELADRYNAICEKHQEAISAK